MRDLYKIMSKLEERGVFFVFQSQSGKYFNMAVRDIMGKEHQLHGTTVTEVESKLKIIWGHLLVSTGMPLPGVR